MVAQTISTEMGKCDIVDTTNISDPKWAQNERMSEENSASKSKRKMREKKTRKMDTKLSL